MNIGTYEDLTVLYMKDFGAFLGSDGSLEKVLLPKSQVPAGTVPGSILKVFLYKDSEDRCIATLKKPLITLGQIRLLTVKETARMGAFLDWGIDKDLLLPFREQQGSVTVGQKVLVKMYLDHSGRLCATMRIYKRLKTGSSYEKGDVVSGTVYSINPDIGIFVAVDDEYFGLLPKQLAYARYSLGDSVSLYVNRVRPDGKLDLMENRPAYQQAGDDAARILRAIDECGGVLPFGEKASPELIKRTLTMSKAAFKRALGHLYKKGLVTLSDEEIRRSGKCERRPSLKK